MQQMADIHTRQRRTWYSMNSSACPRSSTDCSLKNLAMPAAAPHGAGQQPQGRSTPLMLVWRHSIIWLAKGTVVPGSPTLSREKNA